MKKPLQLIVLVFLWVLPVLSACSAPTSLPAPLKTLGAPEGQLDIITWDGFLEQGIHDPAYDWVTGFEQQTGCKVNVMLVSNADEMVSLASKGSYDIVTASGDAAGRLMSSGSLQELNLSLIPSWHSVDERLKNAPWHTFDGKTFGVPLLWAPNVLMYNTDVFPEPPTSWGVLFEEQTLPDGSSNRNRIQAFKGTMYVADAALFLMSNAPGLGISDPYALTREQFDAVIALLRRQRQLGSHYWDDAYFQMEDFKNGTVVVASSWYRQVNQLQHEGYPVAAVIPQEGATGWAVSAMMNARARHPNCAYRWLDYSLTPLVQGDMAAWLGANPSVPAACEASPLLGVSGCKENGYETFDQLFFWRLPVADCGADSRACVPYNDWVIAYNAIITGQ